MIIPQTPYVGQEIVPSHIYKSNKQTKKIKNKKKNKNSEIIKEAERVLAVEAEGSRSFSPFPISSWKKEEERAQSLYFLSGTCIFS